MIAPEPVSRVRARKAAGGSRHGGRPAAQAAFVLLVLLAANAASAAPDGAQPLADGVAVPVAVRAAGGGLWWSVGLLAGSTLSDPKLSDYQWDTSPRPAWGAQVLMGGGRLAAGGRLWRTQTTQRVDVPGATVVPRVGLTSAEFVGLGRLGAIGGTEVLLTGAVGWLHLGYAPEQMTIPVSGPGIPIIVQFSPVDMWTGGGGLAARRALGPHWSLGLGVDHEFFALDTAHRSGAGIVYGRESLGDWSARLEIARRFHRQ